MSEGTLAANCKCPVMLQEPLRPLCGVRRGMSSTNELVAFVVLGLDAGATHRQQGFLRLVLRQARGGCFSVISDFLLWQARAGPHQLSCTGAAASKERAASAVSH